MRQAAGRPVCYLSGMGWRETWRETVESFLREVRGPEGGSGRVIDDPIVTAIAAAREETAELERELAAVSARFEHEERSAEECERRRELAERIDDSATAGIAARFARRHAERAAVLRRKRDVLRDELALARVALNDLLDLVRSATG